MIRSTHTYAILPVSHATYAEIRRKLTDAGYTDQFHDDRDGGGVVIDMHGIAISNEEARVKPHKEEPAMQPHQERVVQEKAELSEKVDKLETFIGGSIYASLPPAEQSRLTRQHLIMQLYEQVLSERIAAF